jgi:CRAL/TRIO domain
MRKKNPNLFENRDLSGDEFQRVFEYQQAFSMPCNTPENHKIAIFRLDEKFHDKYNVCEVFRFIVASLDAKFVTEDELPHDGEIFVNDLQNFGLKKVMQCLANVSMLKNYLKYAQEAAPMKLVQNHFINCSSAIPKLISFIKPFLGKEVAESLQFHSNFDTLHKMVSKECLPEEYGGTAGKSDDINREWVKVLMSKQ